jgi:hypothetical protein
MVIGFACRVVDGHPIVIGIRADRTDEGRIETGTIIDHRPVRHVGWAEKLALVAGEVDTVLTHDAPAAVIIKTIEARTPLGAPRLDDAARMRLHLEGVLLLTAQRYTAKAEVMTGQELGRLVGSDKATLEAEATVLVGKRKEVVEAAAAALGALVLADDAAR